MHVKYLKFYFREKLTSIYMPSKLSLLSLRSTQIFKITKNPFFFYLRLHQVTAAGFIDDLIKLGASFVECELNFKLIITFFLTV